MMLETNVLLTMILLIIKKSGIVLVVSMLILFSKLLNGPPNGDSPLPTFLLLKGTSSLETQCLSSLENMNQLPLALSFLTPLQ